MGINLVAGKGCANNKQMETVGGSQCCHRRYVESQLRVGGCSVREDSIGVHSIERA